MGLAGLAEHCLKKTELAGLADSTMTTSRRVQEETLIPWRREVLSLANGHKLGLRLPELTRMAHYISSLCNLARCCNQRVALAARSSARAAYISRSQRLKILQKPGPIIPC